MAQPNLKNVYLFQPQYAVEFRKENTYWLPYSVGCIWSYASTDPVVKSNFQLGDFIFSREHPDDIFLRMKEPAVCGFSCYIWNEKYCLTIAEMIKTKWPNCVIVFGGAQSNSSYLHLPYIDSVIMGEGEECFTELLQDIAYGNSVKPFYTRQRLQQLDIPSPYTTGLFDSLIEKHPDAVWSMTFETNRGCPYACTFCDWGGTTYSKVKRFELDRIRQDLNWIIGKPVTYLYCADANFGMFRQRDLEIAKMVRQVANYARLDSVNFQYAKNSSDVVFEIAQILGDLSRGVTVSVQSMHEPTLQAVKRKNMKINNVKDLMSLSEQYNVGTYTEVILGLPEETLETWKQGFNDILEMGQHHSIDMWFAQLLTNSELSQPVTRQQYGIKSIVSKDYMPLYNSNDWRTIEEEIELVQRTNTMSTADMVEGYMYGWMIIHFHISGYSQIITRYLRKKGISWRQFYDCMFDRLPYSYFGDHFKKLKSVVNHYLNTGELLKFEGHAKGGHGIHAISYEFMYTHKQQAFDFANEIAQEMHNIPHQVKCVQENFLYDHVVSYPVIIDDCKVEPRLTTNQEFDFYVFRRQGLIKNIITEIDNDTDCFAEIF